MNIDRQIQSGARLTSQLLGYARKGKYEVTPINLNRIVEETSEAFGRAKKEITVRRQLSGDLFALEADAVQMEQVLWNLYINAADAMPTGGELILKTRNASDFDMRGKVYKPQPGRYVLLTVRDTGSGMDRKTMERIYDPFFTTKDMNHGTGLGLASVYGIIKGHGGYIDVCSSPGAGCTFSVYLPASEKRNRREVVNPESEMVRGCETVLLVDDEGTVRQVSEDLLKAMGYQMLSASDGNEALEIYTRHGQDIAVVLLDMVMPMMGGGEVYDRLKGIDPNVKVLLLSGYSLDGEASEILRRGCNGFIQKPFDVKELSKKLRSIIEA